MPARPTLAISRFIVMAMLQAARARRLGLPKNSAYSFGLNRAIFIAAGKQGFKSRGGGSEGVPKPDRPGPAHGAPYAVGEETAYRDPRREEIYFTIGDETQTEAEFAKQIERRFGTKAAFETAWREAEAIVADADLADLRSPRGFYEKVYRPRRDALRARWSERIRA